MKESTIALAIRKVFNTLERGIFTGKYTVKKYKKSIIKQGATKAVLPKMSAVVWLFVVLRNSNEIIQDVIVTFIPKKWSLDNLNVLLFNSDATTIKAITVFIILIAM
jgi:hypothetical protein